MKKWMLTVCCLLGSGLAGFAHIQQVALPAAGTQAIAPAAAPALREPALRQTQPGKDDLVLARVEFNRAKLPEPYRSKNNFAWALAKIDGLDKTEYFAHSGVQRLSDFSYPTAQQMAGISEKPANGQGKFKTLCVNQSNIVNGPDCWDRRVDTEFKILEDLAARLPNPSVAGSVQLYTELAPCASCWEVIKQFATMYPNLQMEVLYRRR
jgi:hypothetical protein